jgi:prepilin-type N-terminal cleavage/methylation domain-containing protein
MNLGTRAFTLIELLVVIAIIAILASFATPTIGSAIERGRSAKCVNNLRQIGTAVLQYVNENDYRFPLIETDPPTIGNGGLPALEALKSYGVTQATLTCPTDAASTNSVAQHGSSYHFSPALQEELASNVNIYTSRGTFRVANIGRLTVASDFTGVHPRRTTEEDSRYLKNGMNVLKADGRVIQR